MAIFQVKDCDNIRETFIGANSTTVTLGGAAQESHPLNSKYAAGDTFWGTGRTLGTGEESIGLWTYNGTTCTQTAVYKSSNGGAPVSFSSGGVGEIFVDVPGRAMVHLNTLEISVVSAATCDIGAAQGLFVALSGTTGPITDFGSTTRDQYRIVRHSGSTLIHDATKLILKGGRNRVTAANDIGVYKQDSAGNWREVLYDPSAPAREVLTAARTYYVRTDGGDPNTGLVNSAGGAFLTIGKALSVVSALDLNTFAVTIQVAAGTYTGLVTLNAPFIGGGTVQLLGDTVTPSNVVISGVTVILSDRATLNIGGFKITGGFQGINVSNKATLNITGKMEYGACSGQHMFCYYGGLILITAAYTISGSTGIHWLAREDGIIVCAGLTVTLSGTPAFSGAFAYSTYGGTLEVNGNTFTGSGTGPRFGADFGGGIITGGAGINYFPGNSAGSTSSPGWYQ
jgi:hypothetical protein